METTVPLQKLAVENRYDYTLPKNLGEKTRSVWGGLTGCFMKRGSCVRHVKKEAKKKSKKV